MLGVVSEACVTEYFRGSQQDCDSFLGAVKLVSRKTELTCSSRHIKITTTNRGTNDEKDQKTSTKDFLQVEWRSHNKTSRRGRDAV